jgi:hypothetical protein
LFTLSSGGGRTLVACLTAWNCAPVAPWDVDVVEPEEPHALKPGA